MPAPATARAKELPGKTLSLDERIRRRAYELYVERGNQSGSELDDWLQAEEEIQQAQAEAIPHPHLSDQFGPKGEVIISVLSPEMIASAPVTISVI